MFPFKSNLNGRRSFSFMKLDCYSIELVSPGVPPHILLALEPPTPTLFNVRFWQWGHNQKVPSIKINPSNIITFIQLTTMTYGHERDILILEGHVSRSKLISEENKRPDPPEQDASRQSRMCCLPLFIKSRSYEGKSSQENPPGYQIQVQDNTVEVIHGGKNGGQQPPVKTITISKSSDIRRMMLDRHDDFSWSEPVDESRIEPLSGAEKREMCKLLVDQSDESSIISEIHHGIISVYKDPSDPTSMIEIFRDRDGNKKKKIHRMPPKKMTMMQKLGLRSCRAGKVANLNT